MHQPDLIANNLSEAVEIILGRQN